MQMRKCNLFAAPLQGFTDYPFRQLHQKYFGGIARYYAPYIRIKRKFKIPQRNVTDLLPGNNSNINLIPQVMTKRIEKFRFVVKYLKKIGYDEVNWNLGCPYPMVTNHGMGSGQILDIEGIRRILDAVANTINISIKTRLGHAEDSEILPLLEMLDDYPIKNITIHPRIGTQKYKGSVNLKAFAQCLEHTSHPVIFNGDIISVEKYNQLQALFPTIDTWMIGRGLIANPFLPQMIRQNKWKYPDNKIEKFRQFHNELSDYYHQKLSGDKHVIMKLYQYWQYFIQLFPASQKDLKKIRKAKSLADYYMAVNRILSSDNTE